MVAPVAGCRAGPVARGTQLSLEVVLHTAALHAPYTTSGMVPRAISGHHKRCQKALQQAVHASWLHAAVLMQYCWLAGLAQVAAACAHGGSHQQLPCHLPVCVWALPDNQGVGVAEKARPAVHTGLGLAENAHLDPAARAAAALSGTAVARAADTAAQPHKRQLA